MRKQSQLAPPGEPELFPLRASLQNKLLVWFILVALVPAVLLLTFYYDSTSKQMQNWLLETTQVQLAHSMDLVDTRIDEVNTLSSWLTQNTELQALLDLPPEQATQYSELTYQFKRGLRYQVYSNDFFGNLLSLMILGENGLDIRSGAEAALVDMEALKAMVNPLLLQEENWRYVSKNFTEYSTRSDILLFCCPIFNAAGEAVGTVILLLNQEFFSSVLVPVTSSAEMFLSVYTRSGQMIFSRGPLLKRDALAVETVSQLSGWKISVRVSPRVFTQQRDQLMQSIVLLMLITLLMTTCFAVLLSERFATPLQEILKKTVLISKGTFPTELSSKRQDEFGQLDWHITTMGMNLQTLLQQRLESTLAAQRLKMKMLQAQMNPHFLYNSLNSIRVIANMQGKAGIATMIEKLTQILRMAMNVEKVTIPLEEELQLLEDYVYLQNIHMNGKIHYSPGPVPPEELRIPVIKFLLQPLAENAILHGLAPRPVRGTLFVNAGIVGTDLEISIRDDGVGMSEEQLARLCASLEKKDELGTAAQKGKRAGHGIALKNLRQQLDLTYGSAAALEITSAPNQGTEVLVRIPIPKENGGPHAESIDC